MYPLKPVLSHTLKRLMLIVSETHAPLDRLALALDNGAYHFRSELDGAYAFAWTGS